MFLVLVVTCAGVYQAILNNNPDFVYSLTTLCFGYYFGTLSGDGPKHT